MTELSRRQLLANLAAGATAGTAIAASGRAAFAQAVPKLKPQQVAYQMMPMGDQRCANCALFTGPNICAILATRVIPDGWCNKWAMAKSS